LIEPDIEIDAVAAEFAFGEHSGNFRGLFARAKAMGIHDHACQPRRQRQGPQAPALLGDPAIGIERPEFAQQASRLLQRGRRRRRRLRRLRAAPARKRKPLSSFGWD